MKQFKKALIIGLILFCAVILIGCNKKNNVNNKKILTIGTPGLSGDFITGFGSSAYDVYIRELIEGYSTLVETEFGEFVWDTKAVLKSAPEVSETTEGHKTYKFSLHDDLVWNNGDKITAKDYVANILLKSSPDWASIATSANAGYYLVNFNDYRYGVKIDDPINEGELINDPEYKSALGMEFEGVNLISDTEFSLTIDKSNLPYFYETTMVSSSPIPYKVYMPNFDIVNGEKGAKIVANNGNTSKLADVVSSTVNTPSTGQRYKPTVSCGPYEFVSFEREIATVRINKRYKTNFEGKKPKIDEVHIQKINQLTDVEQVIAGTIDLVSGVVEGSKIESAKASDKVKLISYARNGYGLLAMATDFGPTKYMAVRQAIGYLFDRNEFLTQILGGYGSLVNGPYGDAQWFYQQTKDQLKDELINYVLNVDKANELLDLSPYKFEQDGVTPYDKSKASSTNEYYRYDESKNILQINHLGTNENDVTTLIGVQLKANAWKAGIKYTTTESDWDTLINNYYYGSTQSNRKYHLFNLATNFTSDYDPFWSWHSSLAGTTNNPTGLKDPELDTIMEQMQVLEPTQKEEFKALFVQFVIRWNKLLPNLPLYSNEYFDVYNSRVTGLKSTPVWSWARDICDLDIK